MKSSQLVAIIRRLEAMRESTDTTELQTRRFERNGVERCMVEYDPKTEAFELEEYVYHQTYQFDDIDLIAIEIYELLQD